MVQSKNRLSVRFLGGETEEISAESSSGASSETLAIETHGALQLPDTYELTKRYDSETRSGSYHNWAGECEPYTESFDTNDQMTHSSGETWHRRKASSGSKFSTASRASDKSLRRFSVLPGSLLDTFMEAGAEPGLDPDSSAVEIVDAVGSEITIIDYSHDHFSMKQLQVHPATEPHALITQLKAKRPEWSQVRWISVNGLSWEAIGPISHNLSLHPLAVEDMLDIPQRTKLDVFPGHIFCCIPLHVLSTDRPEVSKISRALRYFRPKIRRDHDHEHRAGDTETAIKTALDSKPTRPLYSWDRTDPGQGAFNQTRISQRTSEKQQARTVSMEQVSLFLMDDTVVTFFERSASRVTDPILQRLRSATTLLRVTEDPAVLVQAIIDAAVDHIEPIIREYRARMYRLQVEAILKPTMRLTRSLFLIKTDLTMLTNTIGPIATLVDSLREKAPLGRSKTRWTSGMWRDCYPFSSEDASSVTSLVSDTAALYLSDVADHARGFNQDIKQMLHHADSMSTLIFNTINIQSSDAVRLLSLVTVIFLPLTFLSGYFGMNFTQFDSLHHGVDYYWSIAAPCSAGLMALLMYETFFDIVLRVKGRLKAEEHC